MTEWRHGIEHVNGIRIHCVEAGEGPLVLLVHGFPESWYSWRHQLPALADAGYRAVAIDVRGYGRSSAPPPIEAYRMVQHGGRQRRPGRRRSARSRPSSSATTGARRSPGTRRCCGPTCSAPSPACRCRSPPPATRRPTDAFRAMGGDEEFYIEYFQQPGRAEAEIEADVRRWLLGFYFTASGDAPPPDAGGHRGHHPARRPDEGPLQPTRRRCRPG